MKIVGKITNLFLNILIFIIFVFLLLAIYNFIMLNVFKHSYTNYFGYTYFEILTGSMKDEIDVDDYVFVKITKDVNEHDIISYTSEDDVITHRIISINDDEIITKGDFNNTYDEPITKDDVIGKVIFIGHKYGKFMKFITEPIVFGPILLTIILFNLAFSEKKKEGA